jgi:S-methylmethionine-dependent homocysteine/selenocysteine methylase
MAEHLAAAGCDQLLVETMNTVREAAAAARAAAATGLPVMVSFVVGAGGRPPWTASDDERGEIRLLGGETIAAAVSAVMEVKPAAVLVNCVPLAQSHRALELLRAAASGPIGIYANVGRADRDHGWALTEDVLPAAYAQAACAWHRHGAEIVGGCCGTTPEHVRAIASALRAP